MLYEDRALSEARLRFVVINLNRDGHRLFVFLLPWPDAGMWKKHD